MMMEAPPIACDPCSTCFELVKPHPLDTRVSLKHHRSFYLSHMPVRTPPKSQLLNTTTGLSNGLATISVLQSMCASRQAWEQGCPNFSQASWQFLGVALGFKLAFLLFLSSTHCLCLTTKQRKCHNTWRMLPGCPTSLFPT